MIVTGAADTIRREKSNILRQFPEQDTQFCQPEELADKTPSFVLFTDISIPAVGHCLAHGLAFGYWLEGRLFDRNNMEALDALERTYLLRADYAPLKKLNFLRMSLEAANRNTVLKSFPVHLQLEHTTFCNARCIMCDHFVAHNRGAKHLKMDTARRLENIFPYLSLIVMHGNGEPFLNPHIMELMGLYKKYGIRVSTNTNLSFFSDELCGELDALCDSLQVSCDGCTKEVYEGIRQGLSFRTFCDNLRKASSLHGIRRLSLEVVLMQQNIQYAADFVRFADSFGVRTVRFHDLGFNAVLHGQNYSVHAVPDLAIRRMGEAYEAGAKLGVEVRGFPVPPADGPQNASLITQFPGPEVSRRLHQKYGWYTNVIAFQDMRREDLSLSEKPYAGLCEYPFAKTYIDLNGGVSVCCPSSRRRVGRISADCGFEAIWNGARMAAIRDVFYRGGMPNFCRGCFMAEENALQWLKRVNI